MTRLLAASERTGRCPYCGTSWLASHTRPGRRRLWLWQQLRAHLSTVHRTTDPEGA